MGEGWEGQIGGHETAAERDARELADRRKARQKLEADGVKILDTAGEQAISLERRFHAAWFENEQGEQWYEVYLRSAHGTVLLTDTELHGGLVDALTDIFGAGTRVFSDDSEPRRVRRRHLNSGVSEEMHDSLRENYIELQVGVNGSETPSYAETPIHKVTSSDITRAWLIEHCGIRPLRWHFLTPAEVVRILLSDFEAVAFDQWNTPQGMLISIRALWRQMFSSLNPTNRAQRQWLIRTAKLHIQSDDEMSKVFVECLDQEIYDLSCAPDDSLDDD